MKKIPDTGRILISLLGDINFSRSIILLTSCDACEGVFGDINNQQSVLQLSEVIEIDQSKFNLYNGGPVEADNLFFIHRCFDRCQRGQLIFDDLYWGGDFDKIVSFINQNLIHPSEVKFFIGYAKDQLLEDLDYKYWIVTNRFNKDFIFQNFNTDDYWKKAIQNLGDNYKYVVVSSPKKST